MTIHTTPRDQITGKTNQRAIRKIWQSKPTIEGAGVHLRRVFGFQELPLLDPFLLMDDFRSENPAEFKAGFPWHPHRGIETITYILDGDIEHGDSMGNKGIISAGDVQWMTAGSGIIHQEMPQGNRKGEMLGFQLWANLPAQNKMTAPQYRGITHHDIPLVVTPEGAAIRVISGQVNGIKGPIQDVVTEPEYLDVSLKIGQTFTHDVKNHHTVFVYVIEGEADFWSMPTERPQSCGNGTLVLYELSGTHITITCNQQPTRFLLISGKPLNEPIAWYGPIVMNTQAELRQAFDEYQQGTFVKK